MWNHTCIFLYYFHILQSCPLNFSIYAKWDWFLCLWDKWPTPFTLTGLSRCPVPYIVKAILSPTKKATAFQWRICFHLNMGPALGILLHCSIYPSDNVKLSYKDSLCLLRQFSSPCSSSSGLSWLVLTLSSSIKILESACQVPQRTCWDFYWNCIESVYQSEESWHLHTLSFMTQRFIS